MAFILRYLFCEWLCRPTPDIFLRTYTRAYFEVSVRSPQELFFLFVYNVKPTLPKKKVVLFERKE